MNTTWADALEKKKDSCFLGDWEKEVQVGYVRERVYPDHFTAQQRKKEEPEALELHLCEPWGVNVKTKEPILPHWLFCQIVKERYGRVVPSTWEDVKRLPWRERSKPCLCASMRLATPTPSLLTAKGHLMTTSWRHELKLGYGSTCRRRVATTRLCCKSSRSDKCTTHDNWKTKMRGLMELCFRKMLWSAFKKINEKGWTRKEENVECF